MMMESKFELMMMMLWELPMEFRSLALLIAKMGLMAEGLSMALPGHSL